MRFYISGICKVLKQEFSRIIHPRRLIISSEKKVVQLNIGVPVQLFVISALAGGILWSAYATGRFVAANYTIEAQTNTIRKVTETRFDPVLNALNSSDSAIQDFPIQVNIEGLETISKNQKIVASLKKQVNELKTENKAIIDRVRLKTNSHLEELESIVEKTGLDTASLKNEVKKLETKEDAEGGPYIPSEMPRLTDDALEMFHSLDELHAMRKAVSNLPLGVPIINAQERSRFGHRIDPFNGNIAFHSGLDLTAPLGSEIHSTADGVVLRAGRYGSYGNMVDIDHGLGITTRYGHLQEVKVSEGDSVKKGDIIGIQGSTGRSTGAHLHYEVRYNNVAIDPENFLRAGELLGNKNVISQN